MFLSSFFGEEWPLLCKPHRSPHCQVALWLSTKWQRMKRRLWHWKAQQEPTASARGLCHQPLVSVHAINTEVDPDWLTGKQKKQRALQPAKNPSCHNYLMKYPKISFLQTWSWILFIPAVFVVSQGGENIFLKKILDCSLVEYFCHAVILVVFISAPGQFKQLKIGMEKGVLKGAALMETADELWLPHYKKGWRLEGHLCCTLCILKMKVP